MSLGNILIRPQMLDRRPLSTEAEVMDLLTALASRLVEDFMRGGAASTQIVAACSESMADFIPQFKPRLATVGTKLEDWLKPYLDLVKSAPTPDTTVKGLLATADFGFKLVNTLLAEGHTKSLTKQLNGLLDIVETDLGITRKGLEKLFLDILDRMEAKLSSEFLNGNQNEDSLNNFLLSVQIRRARREIGHLLDRIPLPDINPRQLIRDMELRLEATGWDETLDKIQKQIPDIQKQITEGLPKLNKILKFDKTREMGLMRDIGVDGGQYAWYVSWFNGEPTKAVNRFSLAGSEEEQTIKFKHVSLSVLEHWTYWLSVVVDLGKFLSNTKNSFELGNVLNPFLNAIGQGSMTVFSLISSLIDDKGWADFMKVKEATLFKKGVQEGLTFIGSFEHFVDGWAWLGATWQDDRAKAKDTTLLDVEDFVEWFQLILKDVFLSICTLINHDNNDEKALNHEKIEGLTELSRKVVALLVARQMAKGGQYKAIGDDIGQTIVTYLFGGVLVFGANMTAWLLGAALSGQFFDKYWKIDDAGEFVKGFLGGENLFGGLLYSFIDFHAAFDLEGKTDGGKYGLKRIRVDGNVEFKETQFKGYPPRSTSPYLLPFGGKDVIFCSQTHRGRATHNNHTGLIYAVDFLLKSDTEVLAMRGGTVVEYYDKGKVGEDELTYIVIRHDYINTEHDLNDFREPKTTYARYENGKPSSIKAAFQTLGVPSNEIIGTRIQQGCPLMKLGTRSGVFAFDYLQVNVSSAVEERLPSIPFVFKDILTEGVPEKGKYYLSQNKRNTSLDPLVLGAIRGGGDLGGQEVLVDLKKGALVSNAEQLVSRDLLSIEAEQEAVFRRHIVIVRDGSPIQYRMIQSVTIEGDLHKFVIDGNWDVQLKSTDSFMIGEKSFYSYYLKKLPENYVFLAPDAPQDIYNPQPFFNDAPYDTYTKEKNEVVK
jgi:hypothetical protein